MVELLADLSIERLLTSPYRRCVQTVEPFASARGLEIQLRDELGEPSQHAAGVALVTTLADSDVAVCGHGGLELALRDPPKWRKGAVFVVDHDLAVIEVRRPVR